MEHRVGFFILLLHVLTPFQFEVLFTCSWDHVAA